MAVLGWLGLVALLCVVSFSWLFVAANGLGKYNIGGVPNDGNGRARIISYMILIACGWAWVWHAAPFAISLTP